MPTSIVALIKYAEKHDRISGRVKGWRVSSDGLMAVREDLEIGIAWIDPFVMKHSEERISGDLELSKLSIGTIGTWAIVGRDRIHCLSEFHHLLDHPKKRA